VLDSLLIAPFARSDKLVTGTVATDSGNIKISQPFTKKRKRTGIIIPCVDDTGAASYVQSLESTFAARGKRGSWFVSSVSIPSYLSQIQSVNTNKIFEIGCHGYSHSYLNLTGNIYSITKVGATIDVDRDTDTITINPGGTVTGFKAKTLAAIQTELEGLGCTVGTLTAGLVNTSLGEIMADSSGAQASPYTPQLLIDATGATGFFKTEVVDAKTILDTAISTASTSFATPGGAATANVEAVVKLAGFAGCRNVYDQADAEWNLTLIDLFQLSHFGVSGFITYSSATDAQVRARTRSICEMAASSGSIIFLLAHDATECTAAQWAIILDTIAEYSENDIKVMSMSDALNYIKTSGLWSTADDRTYSRTWTDLTDYHLLPLSPCINAGVDLGITTDYAGNKRPQGLAPDMGPYEMRRGGGTIFFPLRKDVPFY
jgi:hypothetical protein